MAEKFTREEEEVIDDLRLQEEAQRRNMVDRLLDKLSEFRSDFPPATPNQYKVKMTPSTLQRVVQEYCGEHVPLELIYEVLSSANYTKITDKSNLPIRVYWLFN